MIADIKSKYRESSGLAKVEVFSRTWAGVEVTYNEKYPAPGLAYADLSSDKSTIVVCLDQKGGVCAPRLKLDEEIPRARYEMGYFIWVPPLQTVWGYANNCRFVRDVTLKFDMQHAVTLVGGDVNLDSLSTPQLMVYDQRVTQCAHLLADTCIDPFEHDEAFGAGVVTAFLSAFFNASSKIVSGEMQSGLAPWQLKLALRHMEAHFLEDVSLSELATLTRLSESRFARGFKTSTGTPPYTWLLKRRVQRAQELMLHGSEPLSSIAVQLGFADQSHFGKAFRRITGLTPKAWQQANLVLNGDR